MFKSEPTDFLSDNI